MDAQPQPSPKPPMDPKKILIPIVFVGCIAFAIVTLSAQKSPSRKQTSKTASKGKSQPNKDSGYHPASEPTVSKNYSRGGFALEGIIYEGAASSALINGKVLKIGDAVNNYTIKNITSDKVTLINGKNETKELSL